MKLLRKKSTLNTILTDQKGNLIGYSKTNCIMVSWLAIIKTILKICGQPYIYSGLIRCADCDLAITPEKHKGHVYYHCTQYNGKHVGQWLQKEEITRQLEAVFQNMQIPDDIVNEIVETLNSVHQSKIEFHNQHFDKLTREHKETTKTLDNLYLDKLR